MEDRKLLARPWMRRRLPRPIRLAGPLLALVICVMSPSPSPAVPGSQRIASGPDISKGRYRETWIDMRVKVPGGDVSVVRSWNGEEWLFSPALGDLVIEGDPDAPSLIERGSVSYSPLAGSAEPAYQSESKKLIRKTSTGYRWRDMSGDWIEFDASGRALRFGNHATKLADVERDASGRIAGFRDAAGLLVISFVYGATGDLEQAQDYTGRTVQYGYTSGVLSTVTDVLGGVWNLAYQGGWLTRTTDPEGRYRDRTYDASGRLLRVADAIGLIAEYAYSRDSRRGELYVQVKDAAGGVVESTYDEEGLLLSRVDNGRRVRSTTRDGNDLLVTDENGFVTRWVRDVLDRPTRIEYATGRAVSVGWHEDLGLVTRLVDERGAVLELSRDPDGTLTGVTEAQGTPEERVTELVNDAFGQPTDVTEVVDGTAADRVSQLEYDVHGNVSRFVDAEGGIYLAQYSVRGEVVQLTDPRGKIWVWEYDAAGNPTLRRDPNGDETHWEYDGSGNRVLYRDELAKETHYEYDARSNLTAVVDPLGHRWVREYDARSLLTATIDPEGHAERYAYGLDGRLRSLPDGNGGQATLEYLEVGAEGNPGPEPLVRLTHPDFVETLFFDPRGRQVGRRIEYDVGAPEERWAYDDAQSLITYTRFDGAETVYRFDPLGRLVELRRPDGTSIDFERDPWDQTLRLVDAAGHATEYQADELGRLVKVVREGGRETSYTYGPAGLLSSELGPDGRKLAYVYDDARNLTRIDGYAAAGDPTPERSHSFGYDARGRLVSAATADASATYVFDAAGRPVSDTVDYGAFQLANTREFYDDDLLKTFAAAGAPALGYGHDAQDRPALITIPGAGSIAFGDYSTAGPQRIQFPGGTVSDRAYDGLHRLEQQQLRDPAGNLGSERSYSYDEAGLLASVESDQGSWSYTYDALDQLTGVDSGGSPLEAYSYDAAGNRQPAESGADPWVYSDRDELLSAGDTTYEYDLAGRMTKRTRGSEVRTFEYGAFGRLRRVKDGAGAVIAEYGYDAFGQRVWKEVAGVRRYFHYSESGVVAETDASGVVERRYGYVPGSFWGTAPMFAQDEEGGTPRLYAIHGDHLATPKTLTDAAGATVWRATHAAFGQASVEADPDGDGNGTSLPLRFPGQYSDAETGLYYNWFRNYDPIAGRYVSADPVGQFGIQARAALPIGALDPTSTSGYIVSLHLYAYAGNNPAHFIDPQGLFLGTLLRPLFLALGRTADEAAAVGRLIDGGIGTGNSVLSALGYADFGPPVAGFLGYDPCGAAPGLVNAFIDGTGALGAYGTAIGAAGIGTVGGTAATTMAGASVAVVAAGAVGFQGASALLSAVEATTGFNGRTYLGDAIARRVYGF